MPVEVPGWLSGAEAECLAELARDRLVLEIGTFKGRSTLVMAETAKTVHTVDWHYGDAAVGDEWTLPCFFRNVWTRDLVDRVVAHVGRAENVLPLFAAETFDLVYVDGSHLFPDVKADIEEATRVVKPDGTIALHDWGYDEICQAAEEILGWRNGQRVGSVRYGRLNGAG